MAKDAKRIAVYGASETGKTTFCRHLVSGSGRIVVFDTMAQFGGLPGFTRLTTLAAVRDHIADRWRGDFRIAYQVPAGREAEILHELSRILLLAQRPYFECRDRRKVLFVIDELEKSYPVRQLPSALWGFPEICSRGRHFGIEVLAASQRVSEVNTRWRGNNSRSYFFRAADHADATTACRMLGPANFAPLMALDVGEYLLFERGQVTPGRHQLKKSTAA